MKGMALIKWLLFLLTIVRTEGRKSIRMESDYSVGEEIMKTILESCDRQNSFPNPVVIFGNFNQLIDRVSIIRINDFSNVTDYEEHKSLKFKASSVVLMDEPPKELLAHLVLLKRATLWDNRIPFFIIGKNTAPCTNSKMILRAMWLMEILSSIYICPQSINDTPEIYTLNPITNYAPYPWKRIDEQDDLNVYRQSFNANISCTHLTYDKTKILNGYNILAVNWGSAGDGWVPGKNYFKLFASSMYFNARALQTIITAANASGIIEMEIGEDAMAKRIVEGSADVVLTLLTLDSARSYSYLFPFHRNELVAVVKLRAEVSTLEKIYRLWSIPVLIAGAIALVILFLILIIKRWSFGLALLDITRFLTYTSIQTDNRYQSFRIYFTTMLIFIVISNGVFQGKIAAFLTTREKSSPAESIHELGKLGYQMYTTSLLYTKKGCPTCEFREASTPDACIELVLHGTKNLCVVDKKIFESAYILLAVDRVKESFNPVLVSFICRENWPLRDRFNGIIMRVVESGLPDYWEMRMTSIPKAKRQSIEAEWASAQYRPVELLKLYFAFQLLAAGLSLATIILCLELCWDRFVNP